MEFILKQNFENLDIFKVMSGNEAIDICSYHDFCLIIMDINLGDVSGIDVTRIL